MRFIASGSSLLKDALFETTSRRSALEDFSFCRLGLKIALCVFELLDSFPFARVNIHAFFKDIREEIK